MRQRLVVGKIPDPLKAHGAWVYLGVSILAGALTAVGRGFLPALLAGLGFAGVFLLASAFALGLARGRIRLVLGLAIATAAPLLALRLEADPSFLAYGLVALFPAALAGWLAERQGFHSPGALAFGVSALVLAAPSAACAGGATSPTSLALLALLLPFFAWRTFRIRRRLQVEHGWSRQRFRAVGLREAALAIVWTAVAVALVHVLA